MRARAHFHRLGSVEDGDVFLEARSRSLVWLAPSQALALAPECDEDVEVDSAVMGELEKSRFQASAPVAHRPHKPADAFELTLVVTGACNLACGYCFARGGYPTTPTLGASDLLAAAEGFLRLTRRPVSSLILFGGEPLLAYPAIERAWPALLDLFHTRQPRLPALALVTNGTLVTPVIAAFLARNDFAITVSLDGPREIHDRCRPFPRGVPSYDAVVAGIDTLRSAGAYFAIEATYTGAHVASGVSVTEIVDHALALGAREVHVIPAFPDRASGITASDHHAVAQSFRVAARRAARRYMEAGIIELYYATNVVHAFGHDRRRRYICTAGIDKFTVMPSGEVVPCYLLCDPTYRFDSVWGTATRTKATVLEDRTTVFKALSRDRLERCRTCWASDWCFACYGPGRTRHGRLGAPEGLECKVYQAMIEAALLECAVFLRERSGARISGKTSM